MGFNGIGVAKSFVHVDTRESSPVVWSYFSYIPDSKI